MGIDSKNYVVTREVALRAGSIENKYRTADGRFILDTRSLQGIRLTSEEYVTGIEGIELISLQEAEEMIAAGGFLMGDDVALAEEPVVEAAEESEEEASDEKEEAEEPEETNEKEEEEE